MVLGCICGNEMPQLEEAVDGSALRKHDVSDAVVLARRVAAPSTWMLALICLSMHRQLAH